jgi:hypothetical protein
MFVNMASKPWLYSVCTTVSLMMPTAVVGQVPAPADRSEQEASRSAAWTKFYSDQAAGYEIHLDGDKKIALLLHPNAILAYSNPVRLREQHGAVFVWTKQGRPEVIGTVWSKLTADLSRRRVAHEFHSFSTHGVHGKRDGRQYWECAKPGIDPRPIPGAPAVASTASARLLQLRSLAKEFSAIAQDGDSNGKHSLRLLPRPLFHFEAADAGVLEGGVFAFVMATDPELFLLLEARDTDAGPVWHYAAARFTTLARQLTHKERQVWECSARTAADDGDAYHYNPQVFLRAAAIDKSERKSSDK